MKFSILNGQIDDIPEHIAKKLFKTFEDIALQTMRIDTLRTRNFDDLDFKEVAVWQVTEALYMAYLFGQGTK